MSISAFMLNASSAEVASFVNYPIQSLLIHMLTSFLHKEGFFPIRWTETATPGTTYVRPGAKGVLRVFVPVLSDNVELFVGSLLAGKLRYSGPVHGENALRQLLADAYGAQAVSLPMTLVASNYPAQ